MERRSAGLIESVLAGNIRRNQGPARGNSINFLFFSFINIMANSIKQRKASSPPEPSIIHLNSNSMEESKIRQSHDKYVGLVIMTLGIASLVLALSVFMRSTPLLRSSSKYLHPKETSETDTAIGVPLSPLSKLIDIIGSQSVNYGRTTLTGTYWLGEEYKLHETSTSCGHTGIIRFPHVDLSSLLSEEASDFFGMRSQQQTQTTCDGTRGKHIMMMMMRTTTITNAVMMLLTIDMMTLIHI